MTDPNVTIHPSKRTRVEMARARELFGQYGLFMVAWSSFEIVIEIAIAKALGLWPEDASLMLGSLTSGPKLDRLKRLLERSPDSKAKLDAVNVAARLAERNALVHSFVMDRGETFIFVSRDTIKRKSINVKQFTVQEMAKHNREFADAVLSAQRELGVSDQDFDDYTHRLTTIALGASS
jgi:hypothetical protein